VGSDSVVNFCIIYHDAVDTVGCQLSMFTERYSDLSLAAQVLNDAAKKKDNERYWILFY